jgi:hypothetical protein
VAEARSIAAACDRRIGRAFADPPTSALLVQTVIDGSRTPSEPSSPLDHAAAFRWNLPGDLQLSSSVC